MENPRVFRSFAMLSGSSAAMIVGGVITAKSWALLIGASGVGLMNVLQSAMFLAVATTSLGIPTAIVHAGSGAIRRGDAVEMAALRRSAALLCAVTGIAAFLLVVVGRRFLSVLIAGDQTQAGNVAIVGIAMLLNLGWAFDTSIINAYQRVAVLAKLGVMRAVGNLVAGIGVVWLFRERGIGAAIAAMAAVSWVAARFVAARTLSAPVSVTRGQIVAATRALLRFGVPVCGGFLAGAGVQYLVPILVFRALGSDSAGFYAAAAMIAVGYASFFLLILGQDYFPRLSAARDDARELVTMINDQQRVLMLAAVPAIVGLVALVRYLVPIIYAPAFSPAVEVLEWMLTGEVLRFSAWTLGYCVLARNGSVTFLFTELASGGVLLPAAWFGLKWFGLPGVGMAFFLAAIVHYVVVSIVVRRTIGFRWSRPNRDLIVVGMTAMVIVRALGLAGLSGVQTVVAGICALIATAESVRLARREMA